MLILIPTLVFSNSKPKSIFWANFCQKSQIVYFAWKLADRVSRGCDCKDREEGLKAKIKMNDCIRCLLFIYF